MKSSKKRSKKAGLPPGSLVHVGGEKSHKVSAQVIVYTKDQHTEFRTDDLDEIIKAINGKKNTWVNVSGIHETKIVQHLGENLGIHPLTLEDIMNNEQRPKVEEFDDYIFLVTRMLSYDSERKQMDSEQVSILLGEKYVLSFQECENDAFEQIRERVRQHKGRIASSKPDYLAYAILDCIVDHYFVVLEQLGEEMEFIEAELIRDPEPQILQRIYRLKRDLIVLRRTLWPLREVVNQIIRSDSKMLSKPTRIYYRDIYDHSIQVIDTVEAYRDLITGMLDTYLSSVSNRLNEVMKMLTIFSTIFIPLTFITGVYGMNFKYMPELEMKYAYYLVWTVMLSVTLVLLLYFRKKKWL